MSSTAGNTRLKGRRARLWSVLLTTVVSTAMVAAMLPGTALAAPTAPPAPTGVAGTHATSGQIDITWSAPSSDGGSPITGYTATASPSGATCTTTGATNCNILVTNGTAYTVAVTATNLIGTSTPSASSASIPAGLPPVVAAPSPAGSGTAGEAALTWAAPTNTYGWPVTGYSVQAFSDAGGSIPEAGNTCSTTGATTCTISGLTAANHWFRLQATTDAGSTWSGVTASAFNPDGVPGNTNAATATAGNATATVTWTAPSTNGSAITSYTVVASPGGSSVTVAGTVLTAVVPGLTNGTLYTFKVSAKNANGSGGPGTAKTATPFTAPDAPTAVAILNTATTTTKTIVVGWTPSANDGGKTITGYTATLSPVPTSGDPSCTVAGDSTANGCTIGASTALPNDTDVYTVTVKATNGTASAASVASAPGHAGSTTVTVPTAPTSPPAPTAPQGVPTLTDVAGTSGELLATWSPPLSDGGSPVTGYTVKFATGSPAALVGTTACTSSALSCTVTGLTNGGTYKVTVSASNSSGMGAPSALSAAASPKGVPGAPTGLAASGVTNTTANLAWVAPTDVGGTGVTSYVVTASGGTVGTISGTGVAVTALTPDTAYTFTVHAVSAQGAGPESAPITVTPSATPSAPLGFAAAPVTTAMNLTWNAPTVLGSGTIVYVVTSTGGSVGTVSGTSVSVTGLVNTTSYTFTVKATIGALSGPVATVSATAGVLPLAPTSPVVAIGTGPGTIDATWTAPTIVPTSYVATALAGTVPSGSCSATTPACTISGLTAGTAYTVSIVAVNSIGSGPAVVSSPVTAIGVPADPTLVTAAPTSTQVVLTWTNPVGTAAQPYAGVAISRTPAPTTVSLGTVTTYTFTGLTNGTEYTFVVKGTNSAGSSTGVTVKATPAAVPGAPTTVVGTPGDASASVAWIAPTASNGSAIVGYRITAVPQGGGATTPAVVTTTSASTTGTISGLLNGTSYKFKVAAVNAAGAGSDSGLSTLAKTPAAVPGAPTGAAAVAGDRSVAVSWVAPASDGGSAITFYTVSATPGTASCSTTGATSATCSLNSLTNFTEYSVSVTATNAAGESAGSTVVKATPTGALCNTAATPFTDISGSFAAANIACIYNLGITTGTSATTYSPGDDVSRAQMGAFVARFVRSLTSLTPATTSPFTDISGSFAAADIGFIFNLGITTGTSATTYSPDRIVTREEMAAFLGRTWRAIGGTCDSSATPFTDISGSFAAADVACIYNLGVTTGTSSTTYSPDADVTRAQMGAFLARMWQAATNRGL